MTARSAWLQALIGAACLVAACTPTSSAPSSVPPTESPAAEVGNLPPGCEPIDLRAPGGERIDLNGTWDQETSAGETPTTWWVRQFGDCVWAAAIIAGFPDVPPPRPPRDLQVLRGRLDPGFVLDGELVALGDQTSFPAGPQVAIYSPIRLLVEFDESGQLRLREDRAIGVQGPRCPDPASVCATPLVLRPAS